MNPTDSGFDLMAGDEDRQQLWLNFLAWYKDHIGGVPDMDCEECQEEWKLFQALSN